MQVVNIHEKFGLFSDHWSPKVIASLNGQDVKLVKVQGEFVWHNHAAEDELFFIIKGSLEIHFPDEIKTLQAGELLVIPQGVEHKPVAPEECWLMLFEPKATKHTGQVISEMTVDHQETI